MFIAKYLDQKQGEARSSIAPGFAISVVGGFLNGGPLLYGLLFSEIPNDDCHRLFVLGFDYLCSDLHEDRQH